MDYWGTAGAGQMVGWGAGDTGTLLIQEYGWTKNMGALNSVDQEDSFPEDRPAVPSKWKALLPADDPRYLRSRRSTQIFVGIALAVSVIIALYVFVQVPWNTTITLNQRNSGEEFGLPIFAILIWPAAYVGVLIGALREKPKPIPYWEYSLGRWIVYLILAAFMTGLLIWSLEFLNTASVS
ncbi:hypothetical protein ACTU6V_11230 [Microbacterium sp. A204]|uniref:hypothetical protein n=1 Tax=Microbacterium sp. A204 TaxID=3457321 RepID=UPI003FD67D3E